MLVFAAALWGPLSIAENVAFTLAAWVPTVVSHHLIEERFRHSRSLARRPRRAMALGFSLTTAAVVLGVAVAALQPSVPVASGSQVIGAAAAERGAPLQTAAAAIRPEPRAAEDDRGLAFDDGCHLKGTRGDRSPRCTYGPADAGKTVVNLGDSHALMYFPALHALAEKRSWRLVNLTRAGCTVADVTLRPGCDSWRAHTLRRVERLEPDLIVVASGGDHRNYEVKHRGRRLDRDASEPVLQDGFTRTLRRMKRTGARVVLIRDQARAPVDVLDCVADNADALGRCAFAPHRPRDRRFDVRAARRAGVRVVDPQKILCEKGRCPAVIGNVLVYRNDYHLTATFARTLAPWLGRKLRAPASG